MPYANDFFSPRGAKPGGKGGGRGGRIKSLVTDLQEVGRSTAMDHSSHDPPSILPRVFRVFLEITSNRVIASDIYVPHWEKKVIDRILDRISESTN